jgi:hypothetical protein
VKVVDVLKRTALTIVAIPALFVVLDTLLRALNAQQRNPIVRTVREAADTAVPDAVTTIFARQTYWQTALLTLLFYGVLALVIVLLFRAVDAVLAGARSDSSG